MSVAERRSDVKPRRLVVELEWGPRGVIRYDVVAEEDAGQLALVADGDWEPFGGLSDMAQRLVRSLGRAYPSLRS